MEETICCPNGTDAVCRTTSGVPTCCDGTCIGSECCPSGSMHICGDHCCQTICTHDGTDCCPPYAPICKNGTICCYDDNPMTFDYCDKHTGECKHKEKCECGCGCFPGETGCTGCEDCDLCTIDTLNKTTGECTHIPMDCDDDNLCTIDSCSQGACVHVPKTCEDYDACTSDSCDKTTGNCVFSPSIHCDPEDGDGDACTYKRCKDGLCVSDMIDCGPTSRGLCASSKCINGTCVQRVQPMCFSDPVIQEKLAASHCLYPYCSESTGCILKNIDCHSDNPCIVSQCDPFTGLCVQNPIVCDQDSNNDTDKCIISGCSSERGGCYRDRILCDDNNPCTSDMCDPTNGLCIRTPIDCGCDTNGRLKTNPCLLCGCSVDAGGCWTKKMDCDDKIPSTIDTCAVILPGGEAECVHTLRECDQDNGGTDSVGADLCIMTILDKNTGLCVHKKKDCYHGITDKCIRSAMCDPTTGACVYSRTDCGATPCISTMCDPSTGECSQPIRKDCDDNNLCTADFCDSQGVCQHEGMMCALHGSGSCLQVYCDPLRGCLTERKDCSDGDVCTADYCDMLKGECTHIPTDNATKCSTLSKNCMPCECRGSDGECICKPKECGNNHKDKRNSIEDLCTIQYCDVTDGTCKTSEKCKVGQIDACTQGECLQKTGECVIKTKNCDDHNPCTTDACDPIRGCIHEPMICQPHDRCTISGCSSDAGGCFYLPKDCDDHDESTNDLCNMTTGLCVYEKKGECDDGLFCTIDGIDKTTGECFHRPVSCQPVVDIHNGLPDRCYSVECSEQMHGACVPKKIPLTILCAANMNGTVIAPYDPNMKHRISSSDSGILWADSCTWYGCDMDTGRCVGPVKRDCVDHNRCTIDSCSTTVSEGCVYTKKDCDDHDPCTIDSCDRYTGQCVHEKKSCGDQDACTIDECVIDTGECVHIQRDVCTNVSVPDKCHICACDKKTGKCSCKKSICNDGDPCTIDSCNTTNGRCTWIPFECPHIPCSVGTCVRPFGSCVYEPLDCDDNDPRTYDFCNTTTSKCAHVWDGHRIKCPPKEADRCDVYQYNFGKATCEYVGPKDCNDNNLCTEDTCRKTDGECVHEAIKCNDSDPCTIDSCDSLTGWCTYEKKSCDDMDACTTDWCDRSKEGECVHDLLINMDGWSPVTKRDDGLLSAVPTTTTRGEPVPYGITSHRVGEHIIWSARHGCSDVTCDSRYGSLMIIDIDCGDGDPCTLDRCVEEVSDGRTMGQCLHEKVQDCVDKNPCTIDECVPVKQFAITGIGLGLEEHRCIHIEKRCDDHNPMTLDSCDLKTGNCVYTPVVCENKDRCLVNETDPHSDGRCVARKKECSDGNPCTTDYCDQTTGSCVHVPYTGCDDKNPCTEDSCDRMTGECHNHRKVCRGPDKCAIYSCDNTTGMCYESGQVSCDDHLICTNDVCDKSTGLCSNIPISCDDQDGCTLDSCEEGYGCRHIPLVCDHPGHRRYFEMCVRYTCDPRIGECIPHYNKTCIIESCTGEKRHRDVDEEEKDEWCHEALKHIGENGTHPPKPHKKGGSHGTVFKIIIGISVGVVVAIIMVIALLRREHRHIIYVKKD